MGRANQLCSDTLTFIERRYQGKFEPRMSKIIQVNRFQIQGKSDPVRVNESGVLPY